MPNSNLTEAKRAKNDEFYTQYPDIEKEISACLEFNPKVFRGKTIFLETVKCYVRHIIAQLEIGNPLPRWGLAGRLRQIRVPGRDPVKTINPFGAQDRWAAPYQIRLSFLNQVDKDG